MSDGLRPLSAGFGAGIEALESAAKAALSLTEKVRAALPEPEKNHVVSAGYHEEILIIAADSAAWTARIRYLEDSFRKHWQTSGEKPFTVLKVRVGRP
jgi:hypothetical protein